MSRVVNDLQDISELAHHGPEDVFLSLVSLIGAFCVMATIHLPLTLIVYTAIPLIVLFALLTRREEIAGINAELENSVPRVRFSKSYTAEETEQKKFNRAMTVSAKQNGLTGLRRYQEIMDQPSEDCESPVSLGEVRGKANFMLFSSLDRPVLNRLSLTVPAGKSVALVGPSGGGKTTLCHLIPRFYEIEAGSITLGGKDIGRSAAGNCGRTSEP